jgi:peptidoglycan/LPS O-acetylase OafA/YrhL
LLIPTLIVRLKGPVTLTDVLFGLTYTSLLLLLLNKKTFEKKNLLNDYLSKFGRISYSFFLIHLPVCNFILFLFPRIKSENLWLNFIFIIIVTFPASYIIGKILNQKIEEPIYEKFRKR